jgi:signal peptidase II
MVRYQRLFGIAVMLLVLLLDLWSKRWVLEFAGSPHPQHLYEVASFFNIVLVWNPGVSFGLFPANSAATSLFLIGLTGLLSVALLVWFLFTTNALTSLALALIIGGAVGNIIDRLEFGAVVDFLDFHFRGYHWPAFNLADSSIFLGVVLLLFDSIMEPAKQKEKTA